MISVCLTTYNGENFIREQLLSILKQLATNDEVVISDDSSTDQTISIIEEMNDKRIRILKENTFSSPIYNLENALKEAKGDFIFIADQDDVWLPNKIKMTLTYLTHDNIVMSDAILCDENLNVKSMSLDSWRKYKSGFIRNLYMSRYLGCCMAFHKNILKTILPFPPKLQAHDVWIGLLAELKGNLTYLPIPLIKYRRHDNNFSSASNKSKNSVLYKITYRLHFFFITFFRVCKIKIKDSLFDKFLFL